MSDETRKSEPVCPSCLGPLRRVTQGGARWMNDDQFDSVKAGDYYCETCKGTENSSGYKYWWARDVMWADPDREAAAPASPCRESAYGHISKQAEAEDPVRSVELADGWRLEWLSDEVYKLSNGRNWMAINAAAGRAIAQAVDEPTHSLEQIRQDRLDGACRLARDLGYATGHADDYDGLLEHVREQRDEYFPTEARRKLEAKAVAADALQEHHDDTVRQLRKTENDRDDAYNLLVKAGWVPHWGLKHAEEVVEKLSRLKEVVTDFLRDMPADDRCDDPVGAVEGWVRCGSCWPCRVKILRDEIDAMDDSAPEGRDNEFTPDYDVAREALCELLDLPTEATDRDMLRGYLVDAEKRVARARAEVVEKVKNWHIKIGRMTRDERPSALYVLDNLIRALSTPTEGEETT